MADMAVSFQLNGPGEERRTKPPNSRFVDGNVNGNVFEADKL